MDDSCSCDVYRQCVAIPCLRAGWRRLARSICIISGLLIKAIFNPFVAVGIVLLIGFFSCYMTALSFADLSFVMPATAFGFVVVALLSHFWLGEHISTARAHWNRSNRLRGSGFVASGPSRTEDSAELDVMNSGVGR